MGCTHIQELCFPPENNKKMENVNILWVDDEIDLLKIQVLFLEKKGYQVDTANNGNDGLEMVAEKRYDIIFLDENMPGLTGLETLERMKELAPSIPVVMITKSEEEDLMNEAIGSKIADYLIKPVNPNQILLSIKKNVQKRALISQKTTTSYQQKFGQLGMLIGDARSFEDWVDIYKKLVYWELELSTSKDSTMDEVLNMQKNEANTAFIKFIQNNYIDWFGDNSINKPLLSQNVLKDKVFPMVEKKEKVVVILIDNLRLDQWKVMAPMLREYFTVEDETIFSSILPTATQYSRNAMFSGLMPLDISKLYPEMWLNDEEEGGKNQFEEELLHNQAKRLGLSPKIYFQKVQNNKDGKRVLENISNILNNDLSVIVYNFIDILSHARTELNMIRELANDESAYRSLTTSWFEHSPLLELFKELSERKIKVVITTDHGTIRVQNPVKVIGDRKTTTNLRYKQGRNLNYNRKDVFEIRTPEHARLPATNLSSTYIFARNEDFFAYPNNYNYYVKYYKDTFQHGGVSLEEMLIPVITLHAK